MHTHIYLYTSLSLSPYIYIYNVYGFNISLDKKSPRMSSVGLPRRPGAGSRA